MRGVLLGLAAALIAAAAAAQTTAPSPPAPTAAQEILYQGEATSILGRTVTGADGAKLGAVVDVLVDEAGQPRAAVLDFGGFLGIGNRRVAVVWRALHFSTHTPDGDISVDLTGDQIRVIPEYKAATKPVTMAAPPSPPPTVAAP
ncbi:MAG TPA: PRC-barrel domain-containing protein [Acetobacteraceae bacterium]|jgi:hypothetical protein|nr:PRC-barrel domain-containing protein [Acetobacteraceae bacterium]